MNRPIASAFISVAIGAAGCASMFGGPAEAKAGALVGPNGKTLYTFDKDQQGSGTSVCVDKCAVLWPPLAASGDRTGDGVNGIWHLARP